MFENREEAARRLALEIKKQIKYRDFVIVAILRGGIVLGRIIADYFHVPLAPLVVRKLGAPSEKELAIGALGPPSRLSRLGRPASPRGESEADGEAGPQNTIYWDEDLIKRLGIDKKYKSSIVKEKSYELKNLENIIMGERNVLDFTNKKVIVVDDGVATGTTVLCANMFLKKEKAKTIILATPVIAKDTFNDINKYFDKVITLEIAPNFYAVGQFYKDFPQVEDDQVLKILRD